MTLALIILTALLGLVTAFSAVGKLSMNPKAVEMLYSLGLRNPQIRLLAVIEILGAMGLLVGTWVPVLGVLAAIGFVLYFLGAVLAHARRRQPLKDMVPALILLVLSIIVMILQFAR